MPAGSSVWRREPALNTIADLARRGERLVNREKGAGARAALDELLAAAGIKGPTLVGYDRFVPGHLEVAAAIAAGTADAGVTIRLAADLYGLDFQPWREERYDLVIPEAEFDAPPVRRLTDALNSGMIARAIGRLCAYDTAQMGRVATRFA